MDWQLEDKLEAIREAQQRTRQEIEGARRDMDRARYGTPKPVFSGKTRFNIFLRVAIGLGAFAVLFFVVLVGIGLIGLIID